MKYFDFGTDGVSGHVCGPDARFGGWSWGQDQWCSRVIPVITMDILVGFRGSHLRVFKKRRIKNLFNSL